MAERGNLQAKLNAGIEAARAGDKVTARRLLQQVISADPDNEVAWMWLASAVDTYAEKRACLERALRINPANARAQEALRRLELQGAAGTEAQRRLTREEIARVRAATSGGGQGGNLYLILAAVVLIVVVAAIVFALSSSGQPPVPSQEANATMDAIVNPSPLPTIDPDTFTPTPVLGVIVTLDRAALAQELPATFTPTFTLTPSETPFPTETPFPQGMFTLLYTAFEAGQSQPGIYRINGDGTGETLLGGGDQGFADAVLDSAGQRIAFVRLVASTVEVTAEPDGAPITANVNLPQLFIAPLNDLGAAIQLTQLSGTLLTNLSWAPDDSRLLFVSNNEGSEDIWSIGADGSNAQWLTDNPGIDKDPVWSPDGTRIAFVSDRDSPPTRRFAGSTEVYMMNADGTNVIRLTNDNNSSYSPSWSPDGRLLTFASDRSGDSDIYTMNADGTNQFLLTVDDGGAEDRRPVFTPDGRSVVFASNRAGGNFQLYRVDLQSLAVTRLLQNDRDVQSLIFFPLSR